MSSKQRESKRSNLLKMLVISGLIFTTTSVNLAYAAEPMTLQDIVNTALKNNPAVIESENRWEEKISKVPSATAQPNPTIGFMKEGIPGSPWNIGDAMMTEISLSQEIMHPAKLKAMGKMAVNDAYMTKANYGEKQLEIYTQTKQAYYDYLYAKQAVIIGKESQQLMGQLTKLAQVNYSTGMVPLQDTLKAQTEFSTMTSDLYNMAAMEAVAKAKLSNLMGKSAQNDFEVKEEFSAPAPNFDLAELTKTATAEKPALIGMEYGVEMAKSGVEAANKERLPDFELSIGYATNKEPMIEPMGMGEFMLEDRDPSWKVEFMVMLPVWQSKIKADIKSAEASQKAAQAALENMQNMAELDVQMALTDAQTSWRQIDLYQNTIIPQAEQTYQAATVSYTNGKTDFMTVLEAVNTLRNAKLGMYKAKVDYEKSIANLEKAVGKPLFLDAEIVKIK